MTGSGLRERKVGEVSYRSKNARTGGQNHIRNTQPSGSEAPIWKRLVRVRLESAGLGVVRTKAA